MIKMENTLDLIDDQIKDRALGLDRYLGLHRWSVEAHFDLIVLMKSDPLDLIIDWHLLAVNGCMSKVKSLYLDSQSKIIQIVSNPLEKGKTSLKSIDMFSSTLDKFIRM